MSFIFNLYERFFLSQIYILKVSEVLFKKEKQADMKQFDNFNYFDVHSIFM